MAQGTPSPHKTQCFKGEPLPPGTEMFFSTDFITGTDFDNHAKYEKRMFDRKYCSKKANERFRERQEVVQEGMIFVQETAAHEPLDIATIALGNDKLAAGWVVIKSTHEGGQFMVDHPYDADAVRRMEAFTGLSDKPHPDWPHGMQLIIEEHSESADYDLTARILCLARLKWAKGIQVAQCHVVAVRNNDWAYQALYNIHYNPEALREGLEADDLSKRDLLVCHSVWAVERTCVMDGFKDMACSRPYLIEPVSIHTKGCGTPLEGVEDDTFNHLRDETKESAEIKSGPIGNLQTLGLLGPNMYAQPVVAMRFVNAGRFNKRSNDGTPKLLPRLVQMLFIGEADFRSKLLSYDAYPAMWNKHVFETRFKHINQGEHMLNYLNMYGSISKYDIEGKPLYKTLYGACIGQIMPAHAAPLIGANFYGTQRLAKGAWTMSSPCFFLANFNAYYVGGFEERQTAMCRHHDLINVSHNANRVNKGHMCLKPSHCPYMTNRTQQRPGICDFSSRIDLGESTDFKEGQPPGMGGQQAYDVEFSIDWIDAGLAPNTDELLQYNLPEKVYGRNEKGAKALRKPRTQHRIDRQREIKKHEMAQRLIAMHPSTHPMRLAYEVARANGSTLDFPVHELPRVVREEVARMGAAMGYTEEQFIGNGKGLVTNVILNAYNNPKALDAAAYMMEKKPLHVHPENAWVIIKTMPPIDPFCMNYGRNQEINEASNQDSLSNINNGWWEWATEVKFAGECSRVPIIIPQCEAVCIPGGTYFSVTSVGMGTDQFDLTEEEKQQQYVKDRFAFWQSDQMKDMTKEDRKNAFWKERLTNGVHSFAELHPHPDLHGANTLTVLWAEQNMFNL